MQIKCDFMWVLIGCEYEKELIRIWKVIYVLDCIALVCWLSLAGLSLYSDKWEFKDFTVIKFIGVSYVIARISHDQIMLHDGLYDHNRAILGGCLGMFSYVILLLGGFYLLRTLINTLKNLGDYGKSRGSTMRRLSTLATQTVTSSSSSSANASSAAASNSNSSSSSSSEENSNVTNPQHIAVDANNNNNNNNNNNAINDGVLTSFLYSEKFQGCMFLVIGVFLPSAIGVAGFVLYQREIDSHIYSLSPNQESAKYIIAMTTMFAFAVGFFGVHSFRQIYYIREAVKDALKSGILFDEKAKKSLRRQLTRINHLAVMAITSSFTIVSVLLSYCIFRSYNSLIYWQIFTSMYYTITLPLGTIFWFISPPTMFVNKKQQTSRHVKSTDESSVGGSGGGGVGVGGGGGSSSRAKNTRASNASSEIQVSNDTSNPQEDDAYNLDDVEGNSISSRGFQNTSFYTQAVQPVL